MEEAAQEIIQPEPILDRKWYEIWLDILIHPGAVPFRSMLKERDHSVGRAILWVTITALATGVVGVFFYASTYQDLFNRMFNLSSINESGASTLWIFGICYLVTSPILGILSLVLTSGVFHFLSRLFKGTGAWSDLVFCLGGVQASISIITLLITIPNMLIGNNQSKLLALSCVISLLSLSVSIYGFVLMTNAVRVAEKIGTGQAAVSILIPGLILIFLGMCVGLLLVLQVLSTTQFR